LRHFSLFAVTQYFCDGMARCPGRGHNVIDATDHDFRFVEIEFK
jgi:hypothetical protein